MRRVYIEFQMWPSYLARSVCWFASLREAASSGSGSPARTHHHLYIPIKNTPTVTCSSIFPSFKSATYMASLNFGRIYVQPVANIIVIDHPNKSPQNFFLVE